MEGREPTRWVLHSSISSVLGGLGLAAYAGANAVLDSIATRGGPTWLSIGWDAWDNAAEAQMAGDARRDPTRGGSGRRSSARCARRCGPRVVVAVGDLEARLESWVRRSAAGHSRREAVSGTPAPASPRPSSSPSETERALAEIWASQLGLERVGVHDRFFDLGGHSLLAVQVASEIRDRFQIEMPVLQLFKAPTVRELAELVEAGHAHRRRRRRRRGTGRTADRHGVDRRRPAALDERTDRRRATSPRRLPRVLRRRHAPAGRRPAWARRRSS